MARSRKANSVQPVKVKLRICTVAAQEHRCSARQYAHTFHYRSPTICLAPEFAYLPSDIQAGLIAHEIGHLLMERKPTHSEREADEAVLKHLKLRVLYGDSRFGKRLQFLNKSETEHVMRFSGFQKTVSRLSR